MVHSISHSTQWWLERRHRDRVHRGPVQRNSAVGPPRGQLIGDTQLRKNAHLSLFRLTADDLYLALPLTTTNEVHSMDYPMHASLGKHFHENRGKGKLHKMVKSQVIELCTAGC